MALGMLEASNDFIAHWSLEKYKQAGRKSSLAGTAKGDPSINGSSSSSSRGSTATGKAHYSKNWHKEDQDRYNAVYYQNNKWRWQVNSDSKSFMKEHGGSTGKKTNLGDEGDYYVEEAKDGTKALMREDTILAAGNDLKTLDTKSINAYLNKAYKVSASDRKNLEKGSDAYAEYNRKFNKRTDSAIKKILDGEKPDDPTSISVTGSNKKKTASTSTSSSSGTSSSKKSSSKSSGSSSSKKSSSKSSGSSSKKSSSGSSSKSSGSSKKSSSGSSSSGSSKKSSSGSSSKSKSSGSSSKKSSSSGSSKSKSSGSSKKSSGTSSSKSTGSSKKSSSSSGSSKSSSGTSKKSSSSSSSGISSSKTSSGSKSTGTSKKSSTGSSKSSSKSKKKSGVVGLGSSSKSSGTSSKKSSGSSGSKKSSGSSSSKKSSTNSKSEAVQNATDDEIDKYVDASLKTNGINLDDIDENSITEDSELVKNMLSEMQKGTSRTTTAAKIAESLKKRKSRSVIAHGIDFLEHHGIIGQKWGVRRYQNEDGSLTEAGKKRADRLDAKWVKKKEKKTRERALNEALNDKRTQNAIGMVNASYPGRSMYKTNGQLKASYTNQINRILADSMTEKVSNMRSPSGRVISFVAATGSHKIGDVYTAFSDEGYDFSKLKNGINSEGKLSYKRKKKENYLDMMEN